MFVPYNGKRRKVRVEPYFTSIGGQLCIPDNFNPNSFSKFQVFVDEDDKKIGIKLVDSKKYYDGIKIYQLRIFGNIFKASSPWCLVDLDLARTPKYIGIEESMIVFSYENKGSKNENS